VSALVAPVRVSSVCRISPSFVRVWLHAPELAELGPDGPTWDQRIKLVFGARRWPASLEEWLEQDPEERGQMRTYTVRDVVGSGSSTTLVVDVVVHEDGHAGPGARWALAAEPGCSALLVGPRRGHEFGGIEFTPTGSSYLLVGDETAVPAVAGILRDLPADARGSAYLEVPFPADAQTLSAPAGFEVTWFARGHEEPGVLLVPAVRAAVGLPRVAGAPAVPVPDELWETPAWSSSGEPVDPVTDCPREEVVAWIAGESAMVTALRRAVVSELGLDRRQVAFMGYWRRGVAMRG
jgi:NADPH-dependent ferric siderophore reductase